MFLPLIYVEIVEFFFVDTTPFVEEYFTDPGEHTYDWEGVLPRLAYLSELLKVGYNLQLITYKFKFVGLCQEIMS